VIERSDNLNQVCCDTCPASYPNTYADEDFGTMIADAKAAGWLVRPARPDADRRDTSDLFGAAPRVAGNAKPQRYMHFCPACKLEQRDDDRRLL
jgi:hypothetical protein